MEEIKNIVDEFEEFDRFNWSKYNFPAVTITKGKERMPSVLFNAKCNPLLKKNIQLKMSDNYVFFRFTDIEDRRYYKPTKNRNTKRGSFSGFRFSSIHLNRTSLLGKSFKLYKYKDGYLIDVRKPLGEGDE